MVRRGQKTKRAEKQASKVLQNDLHKTQEQGAYKKPDRELCMPRAWFSAVDDLSTIQLSIRIWKFQGKLVDFVITLVLENGSSGRFEDVRVDCCHGHAHFHPIGNKVTQHVCRLDKVEDVKSAFEMSYRLMQNYALKIRDQGQEVIDE